MQWLQITTAILLQSYAAKSLPTPVQTGSGSKGISHPATLSNGDPWRKKPKTAFESNGFLFKFQGKE